MTQDAPQPLMTGGEMTIMPDARRRLERGPWLNYTTHQVACPVGPWQTKSKEALCTCGYTLLVDAAIAAGAE